MAGLRESFYTSILNFCSLISVSKKWDIEIMLNTPLAKIEQQMNKKRNQEYQSMDTLTI